MPKRHLLRFFDLAKGHCFRKKCRFGITYDILSKNSLLRNAVSAFLTAPGTIELIIWKKKVSNKLKDYVGIIKIHSKRQLYVSIMEKMLFL